MYNQNGEKMTFLEMAKWALDPDQDFWFKSWLTLVLFAAKDFVDALFLFVGIEL